MRLPIRMRGAYLPRPRWSAIGLAAAAVCAVSGCGSAQVSGSGPTPTQPSATTGTSTSATDPTTTSSTAGPQGLLSRVAAAVPSCADAGSDPNTGAADKVTCLPQAGVEVDFYQFSDQGSFNAAWLQLTDNPDQPYQAGNCNSSSEDGTLTLNGNGVGSYACPASTSNPNAMVWDNPGNLTIGAIQAPSYYPADLRIYWVGIRGSIY